MTARAVGIDFGGLAQGSGSAYLTKEKVKMDEIIRTSPHLGSAPIHSCDACPRLCLMGTPEMACLRVKMKRVLVLPVVD